MARVVILDDDVGALALARQAVRAAGHEPIAVTSAADARAALDSAPSPEILLASPRADRGEALALVSRIRSQPATSRPALLLLGGDASDTAPGVGRVPVPVIPATLAARVSEALAARSLMRRLSAPHGDAARPAVDLRSLASLTLSADYFQVLGVPRTAARSQVREAAAQLLAELDALRLAPDAAGLALEDVRQVVVDARDVLQDERLRADYVRGIDGGRRQGPSDTRPDVANTDPS